MIYMVTGGPGDKPAFLDPKRAETTPYAGADAVPAFDNELDQPESSNSESTPSQPSRGYIDRYREVARLHAFGRTNNEIAQILGYGAVRISLLLKDPFVQKEIDKWRQHFFDSDAVAIMKDAARDGARRIHNIILDPKAKDTTVLAASQFAVEKAHGKAKQEVAIESQSLAAFTAELKAMRQHGDMLRDVSPQLIESKEKEPIVTEPIKDEWTSWVDQNI